MTSTRGLVDALLARLGEGDAAGAASLFADTVDFEIPHDPVVWWIPPVSSREHLAAFFEGLGAHLEPIRFEVGRILVDGPDAVVLGIIEDRVRRTGRSFASPFSLHLRADAGQLTTYRFLEDSATVADAARADSPRPTND